MKKILIISPGPFCKTDNDGQTLEDIFQGWDKDCIAQFYIQPLDVDSSFCNNYFCMSDRMVLNKLLRKKDNHSVKGTGALSQHSAPRKVVKTPITCILRNVLWSISPWNDGSLDMWIKKFDPEILFFEIGDNTYMMDFVIKMKMKLNIPLVVHNTEGFYFFKDCYMRRSGRLSKFFYPSVHKNMRKWYRKTMAVTDYMLYSCKPLQDDYSKEFKIPSSVIYKSTKVSETINKNNNNNLVVSYLGSLGLHRPLALIEIANTLKEINSEIKIDVYGKCNNPTEAELLKNHPNIDFKGFVSFDEVTNVIKHSDLLVHAESKLCAEDVLYGFSTKIPDSLGSGTCFFCYTPQNVAGSRYIKAEIPELVANSLSELKDKITPLINDKKYREEMALKCMALAKKNHNRQHVVEQLNNIIYGL